MLSYRIFIHIKTAFAEALPTPRARDQFRDETREVQISRLRDILPDIPSEQIRAFLLVFREKMGLFRPDTQEQREEREALGVPPPCPWHKENPPRDVTSMLSPERVPSWVAEYGECSAIATNVSFPEARNKALVGAAILSHFDIGGVQDTSDPRSLAWVGEDGRFQDPTMELLVETVMAMLPALHPDWFDEDGRPFNELPRGSDGRSQAEVVEAHQAEERRQKEAERKEREERRRAEQAEEYQRRKESVFSILSRMAHESVYEEVKAWGHRRLWMAHAEARKETRTWLPESGAGHISAVSQYLKASGADTARRKKGSTIPLADHLVEQFFLDRLAQEHEDWFRRLVDGDLQLRAPKRQQEGARGPRHPVEVTKRKIRDLVEKYSKVEVLEAWGEFWEEHDAAERDRRAREEASDETMDEPPSPPPLEATPPPPASGTTEDPAAPPAPPPAPGEGGDPAAPPAPPAPPKPPVV